MSDLEPIARALHETSVAMQDGERSDPVYLNWEDLPVRERKWFFAFARAARKAVLEGLMEPGEETIRAGAESPGGKALDSLATFGHVHGFKLPSDPPPLVSCWQAMLRRKLEECA